MNTIRFSSKKINYLALIIIICAGLVSKPVNVKAQTDLEEIFLSPPDKAKPRGYWIWPHGNFDYTRITEELREFKEKGLGGVDIYDMGISDPYDIIPPGNAFLSQPRFVPVWFCTHPLEVYRDFREPKGHPVW